MLQYVYAVVFMDFEMPVMGGIESTLRIREREISRNMAQEERQCIVGVTANSSEEMCQQGINAGMNDFTLKPLNMESITRIIRKINTSSMPYRKDS
jgi:CheY-like chemotaxis protein